MRIAHITTARSDYGPAHGLLHDLARDSRFDLRLVVGGSHLSPRYGTTVREIERDGLRIAARVPFLGRDETLAGLGRAAGRAFAVCTALFERLRPDLVLVYGDRFELLPICGASMLARCPIGHLCGGDVTEGAIDDQVRHAVTKMAHVHMPSTAESAERVLDMGEEAWRVHHVGDPAVDQFLSGTRATPAEIARALGFEPDRRTLLVTLHPATLEPESVPEQAEELCAALETHRGHVVVTAPAPDPGSRAIRDRVVRLARRRPGTVFVESLGSHLYRGVMRCVGAMVGNSSSGLVEAPSVPLPVVNVGRRQQGRVRARNVIDVEPERAAIGAGIETALSPQFLRGLAGLANPYGDGAASGRVLDVLAALPSRERLLHKVFTPRPRAV